MVLISNYELSRSPVSYQDVNYTVIQVLENNFLLVVKEEDFKSEQYPIQTFIIPDPIY